MSLELPLNRIRRSMSDHRSLRSFHRCPLCGTVNLIHEPMCGTCGWQGVFDERPDSVAAGLYELAERCPELTRSLLAPCPAPVTGWRAWWQRVVPRWLQRRRQRASAGRLDVTA